MCYLTENHYQEICYIFGQWPPFDFNDFFKKRFINWLVVVLWAIFSFSRKELKHMGVMRKKWEESARGQMELRRVRNVLNMSEYKQTVLGSGSYFPRV